jgi:hypothetical protein
VKEYSALLGPVSQGLSDHPRQLKEFVLRDFPVPDPATSAGAYLLETFTAGFSADVPRLEATAVDSAIVDLSEVFAEVCSEVSRVAAALSVRCGGLDTVSNDS